MIKLLLILMLVVLFSFVSCHKEKEPEPPISSKEFIDIDEIFPIYNGSMPNGWTGDIMVAMDGSVLADRISVDGGVNWSPKIPLLGGAGRVMDETTGDILKLDPGGAGRKPENFMYRSKDSGFTWT